MSHRFLLILLGTEVLRGTTKQIIEECLVTNMTL